MDFGDSGGLLIFFTHLVIIVLSSFRVIMVRHPVGVALAWIILIVTLPVVGAALYFIVGEKRLGKLRLQRANTLKDRYARWLQRLPPEIVATVDPHDLSINRPADADLATPTVAGNGLVLMEAAESILRSIIADLERAERFCHMEFYIWNEGGTADDVCEAVIRAAKRGVTCRILIDAVGSSRFLKSKSAHQLRENGVQVVAALPVGVLELLRVRFDLRLHRKIVVVDNEVAYTGSFNLVDPRFFKQEAGVGEWVDAMVRIEGPIVNSLSALFLWDWEVETGQNLNALLQSEELKGTKQVGPALVRMVPSGPGPFRDSGYQLLLSSIYAARKELVMTTPYFVPDESVLTALVTAARRGVNVTLIVPEKVDSTLVRYASRSFFDELLSAGVCIFQFREGLLHTKSVTVDGHVTLFGTFNLDIRSFWLDFEVTLCVYDAAFATKLLELQQRYIANSHPIQRQTWPNRPMRTRFAENLARLAAPLL
jgi:cardiolipin synthase A/B